MQNVKCGECDKKFRSQLVRCIHCGTLYHRGCLPINSIPVSTHFVMSVVRDASHVDAPTTTKVPPPQRPHP